MRNIRVRSEPLAVVQKIACGTMLTGLLTHAAKCTRKRLAIPKTNSCLPLQQLRCRSFAALQENLNLNTVLSRSTSVRSWIFSANSRDAFEKAATLGADVIVLDMEDSVPREMKNKMRDEYRTALEDNVFSNTCVYVRVNETSCPSELEKDVDLLSLRNVAGFILPKTESKNDIQLLEEMVLLAEIRGKVAPGKISFVPIVETPRAYFHLEEIASSSPRIAAIIAGNADLAANVLCEDHSPTYDSFYSRVVLAAKAAKIEAVGGVHDKIDDITGFEKFCYKMKRCGFGGVVTLTPKQVALANRAFSYTNDELQWAKRVVEVTNVHNGHIKTIQRSIQESRQMIGPPHYQKASAMLERNRQQGKQLSQSKSKESSDLVIATRPPQQLDPTLKVGELLYSPLEVTVTESWKTLWDSAFLSMGILQNSQVKSSELGLDGIPLPFSLLATMVVGFTVMVFSHDARVHLGFYNMFQNRPVLPGDTLRAAFCVDSAQDTLGKDGNRYTIAYSTHWLVNQKNQVVFSTQKRTMFAPRKVEQRKATVNSQALTPEDSFWQKTLIKQPTDSLLSFTPQPTLAAGQVYIHSFAKIHNNSEMRMLASLLRITNPHHHNKVRYLPTDILVPGPFVMAAALGNTAPNLGEIVYEDILMAANLNKVNPGDQIGTISYILDSQHLAENPDLEQVTVRHLAIKNTNIEQLQETGVPQKLLDGTLTKPSQYEAFCQQQCPLLFHKIACQMVRRFIRVSPEISLQYQKDREIPEELQL